MILAVITYYEDRKSRYAINKELCSYRYRFDLGLEDKPDKHIILLRTGESSTSGHYLLLAQEPTEDELKGFKDAIKDRDTRTDLSTSKLSVLDPRVYSE